MTATTSDVMTPRRGNSLINLQVAAGVVIWGGSMVVVEAGYAQMATEATGLIYMGRCEEHVDNSMGAAGAVWVHVLTPAENLFQWLNDTTNPVTQAMVGEICYILDNQTVTANATGTSVAGKVIAVDSDGVWVQ